MRILYLSQYYPPEIGATQTRAFEMARGLVRAGHSVTVLTEMPNHPQGVLAPEYRGRLIARSREDGIDVIRVWVKASPVKNFRARMAFYLSYMTMASLTGLWGIRGEFDVIYATSPPLFVGGSGLALHAGRRTPLVFEVRDLWPESAVQLGELHSSLGIALATRLEEACYRRAHHIVAATEGIHTSLLERGLSAAKVTTIANGANTDLYFPRAPDPALRQRLGISPNQFVILYTGLLGLAHRLDIALEAADCLRDHEEIIFLFVGDGPQKDALVQKTAQLDLSNVRFLDAVPEAQLPAVLALGHLGIDVLHNLGISRGAVPVKMYSYMASQLPVLLGAEGEAAAMLRRYQAGLAVSPEAPADLADAILSLKANPQQRGEMGRNGRRIVEERYSRQAQAAQLADLLTRIIGDEEKGE